MYSPRLDDFQMDISFDYKYKFFHINLLKFVNLKLGVLSVKDESVPARIKT